MYVCMIHTHIAYMLAEYIHYTEIYINSGLFCKIIGAGTK